MNPPPIHPPSPRPRRFPRMNYGPSTRAANRLWRRMALMALIACAGVIFAAGGPTGCGVLVGAAAGGAAGYAVGSASSDSSDQPSEKPIR